jgi:pimeloyl-ACP methyl ester carboxylesterase
MIVEKIFPVTHDVEVGVCIFSQIGNEFILPENLRKITQPTFILWGKRDRVLKPQMADHYLSTIPGARFGKVMLETGHTPIIEAPRRTAKEYLGFLGKLQTG